MHFLTRISLYGRSRQVILPKLLCELGGLKIGDTVMFTIEPDKTIRLIGNDELNKRLANQKEIMAEGVSNATR